MPTLLHILMRHIARLEKLIARQQRQSDRLAQIRLILFIAGAFVLATAWLGGGLISGGLALVIFAGFGLAVGRHRQVESAVHRSQSWRKIKQAHVARMQLDWQNLPAASPVPDQFDHPFAMDLDLIGDRSVHHLLDTAVTQEGSDRLLRWLTAVVPDVQQTERRQALARELARLSLFRDRLALYGGELSAAPGEKWPGQKLLGWVQKSHSPDLRFTLRSLWGLTAVNWLLIAGYLGDWLPPLWIITWTIYSFWSLWQVRRLGPLFENAFFLRDNLEQLGNVFGFLEKGRVGRAVAVRALLAPFLDGDERPSNHLRRINKVVAAVSVQKNPFLWTVLNLALPWDLSFGWRLEQVRQQLAEHLPGWLDVWFELEAAASLAGFAWRSDNTSWPELTKEVNQSNYLFIAKEIGHPLIPEEGRVCNDYQVKTLGEIGLITGSNMAGKSSFLRTIGVNLALAYAGGPVMAERLQTIPFRMFSSIRLTDSVTDGFSFFYAEVRRLKQLLDALNQKNGPPLFFFIDEIFKGTNNRERLIGSRAYVQAIAGKNGIGLIATHDLELVKLADGQPAISNFHFRDEVVNGRMTFDYTLRRGPCPTTNALKIMRQEGLPIEDSAIDN